MNGRSYISVCAFFNSVDCFYSLLKYYKKMDILHLINCKDNCNRSPIHFACFGSDISIIQELQNFGETFDSVDSDGLLPVHYAAMNGNINVIKYLYENRSNMFSSDNKDKYSPLHFACKLGHLNIVKYYFEHILSESHIDDYCDFLSSFCPDKVTPLHIACEYGQNEVLDYLLNDENMAKAQINFNNNLTPLFLACASGSLKCVKLLFDAKNIFLKEKYQIEKSFYYAISYGKVDILIFLFKHFSYDVSSIIILEAIANGYNDVVSLLIQNTSPSSEYSINIVNLLNDEIGFKLEKSPQNNMAEKTENLSDSSIKEAQKKSSEILEESEEKENHNEIDDSQSKLTKNSSESSITPSLLPIPIISTNNQSNSTTEFIPHKYTPCPFIKQSNDSIVNQQQVQIQLNWQFNPSSINYTKNHQANAPKTFLDLSQNHFKTKDEVLLAVQNISILEMKSVHIVRSEERRVVYKCIEGCNFTMTWRENNGLWSITENGFKDHTCNFETAKTPRFHAHFIDNFIESTSLSCTNNNIGMTIMSHFFGEQADRQTLRRRLNASRIDQQSNEYWWQVIPSYLQNNIINGGLSDMKITEDNEVYSFAMVPQYGKLLLASNAILPVIILDGTFQCSVYRGTMIIVMVVSSNRTNIPIGWSWGPSESEESIKIILKLIKEVNQNIETIISDDGTALKAAIKEIFPNSVHKLCAWHVSNTITDPKVKKIFWQLLRADHPLIFQSLLSNLFQISGDSPSILANGRIGMFARFFEGVKQNDIISSSPCESINSEIRKYKTEMPIKIFHYLEEIGYNRCLDLLDIESTMTPYYLKRKQHIETKAQRLKVIHGYGTSRTIIDTKYPIADLKWEVNTRDYHCDCGKYTDRGFPCAHLVKAFQDLNQSYEQCVHQCYFTSTIKNALQDLHRPVPLYNLEVDSTLKKNTSHTRTCRINRYLFGFEKSQK